MTMEEIRDRIKAQISCLEFIEKAPKGGFICPFCKSGTGRNKTGALKYYEDSNTIACFAGCREPDERAHRYDVLDLIKHEYDTDYNGAMQIGADRLNITIRTRRKNTLQDALNDFADEPIEQHAQDTKTQQRGTQGATETPAKPLQNLQGYFAECNARINDPAAASYLLARGISTETAARLNIGYDPAADPAGTGHKTPRIIVPTSSGHYVGRRIDNISEYSKMNNKGGKPDIFNKAALYGDSGAVFVVEGAFDAMSIEEVGGQAIALNSVNNCSLLIKQLQKEPTAAALIICLDSESEPQKQEMIKGQQDYLRQELTRLNISFTFADICNGEHDANDALTTNKKQFTKSVQQAITDATKPDNASAYIDSFMICDIEKLQVAKKNKTGFSNLDSISGGLYPGLYVLAAISSLGKTTFAGQIADNLAASGQHVLFFSMEQSRLELVTKSLARMTAQAKDKSNMITSLQIREGEHAGIAQLVAAEYKERIGDRLSIIEGNFNCTVSFIGNYIRNYARQNHCAPVVIIDYLQILQPDAEEHGRRPTTKETVDTTVTMLKQISREIGITIIAISSVNRANYLTPIDFESLKESGSLEFTADVIYGLQLAAINNPSFADPKTSIIEKRKAIKAEKAKNPRRIELVCLKNRYGISSYNCFFDYDPAHDLYTAVSDASLDFEPATESPFDEKPKKTKRKRF